jgi:hypothetical protein
VRHCLGSAQVLSLAARVAVGFDKAHLAKGRLSVRNRRLAGEAPRPGFADLAVEETCQPPAIRLIQDMWDRVNDRILKGARKLGDDQIIAVMMVEPRGTA